MGLKIFPIVGQSIVNMCEKGEIIIKCTKGLPKGTKCVGGHYDHVTNAIELIISHKSFPEVPEGAPIPKFTGLEFTDMFEFTDYMKMAIKKNEK
jgi:hypothetical protein